jgi:hypothetical protein
MKCNPDCECFANIDQFWDEIKGPDGIVRQLQWTARVEGNDAYTTSKSKQHLPLPNTQPVTNLAQTP